MELDLTDSSLDLKATTPRELEEILEDPFAIRFLPDLEREDGEARYYTLGRTVQDRHLFLAFWTNGKTARIIAARDMTDAEIRFYQRNYGEIN
ncbi:BrnT family toxin [Verrucomicrobiaceae bacterium N1E253]|uniref:BrnT family toxin n=1 Tax=Oceaniferula marina TaxID=2748318 RepID=A0A851GFN7_9BACT|nr:BrnT family toxin [Oceaniferula marina]NWK56019.1 BrnT family toxin [Oceaniferula marina]